MSLNKSKIKILQVITLFSVGGATETVISMASGLKDVGYDVHIATGPNIPSEGSMYETAKNLGIPVFTFKNMKRAINPIRDLITTYQLIKFIKSGEYDVVHTHSSKAGVIGRIAAKIAGAKVIVHTVHGLHFHQYQSRLKYYVYVKMEKFASLFCDKVIGVTFTIIDTMIKNNIIKQDKGVMIRSAFDLTSYQSLNFREKANEIYGIQNYDIVIGNIGRFSILKGHQFLIDAFKMVVKEVPNAKLLLVGNGELEKILKEVVQNEKLSNNIIFTGLIKTEDIPQILDSIDILVHTSLLEGLARVIPQAMMMEKPVISFDIDGANEVIINDYNGYLVAPKDIKMLTLKIIDLCKDKNKSVKFGKNGRISLGDQFSEKKMVDQIEKLYIKLLT